MGIIFSSFNGLEPKLRFPNFIEKWTRFEAENIFKNITDKNHPTDTVLTIQQGRGTLPRDLSGRNILYDNTNTKNYKRVQFGDFIIHLRSFEGGLEMANEQGIVSPAYTILRYIKPIAFGFYKAYFRTNEFINHILSKSVEGIRDGKQISYDAFKWLAIPYCQLEEQQKIADFLSLVDQRIEKQRQLVESLKKYKRGLFLKLYGSFEKKSYKISELGKYCATGTLSKDDIDVSGVYQCILYGELFTKYGETIRQVISRTNVTPTYLSSTNEILFPSSTTADALSLIFPSSLKIENIFLGGDLFTIKLKNEFDSDFISYLINFVYKNTFARYAQGITIIHLHYTDIKEQIIDIPDIVVQLKISDIMKKIEAIIENNDNELNSLLLMKKSFLQQMFI